MPALYKPRRNKMTVDYNRRRKYRLLQSAPSSPFATPIQLGGKLNTTISTGQINQLVAGGYVHSTIVGFNEDYKTYSQSVNITHLGQQYREKGRQDLFNALDVLQRQADDTVDVVWGKDVAPGMSPSTNKNGVPTLDHLVRAQLLLHASPIGAKTTEWIAAYEGWQKAKGQYLREISIDLNRDVSKRRELLMPAAAQVKNAAQNMIEHITAFFKTVPEVPLDAGANKKVTTQLRRIMAFDPMTNDIGSFNDDLKTLAQYFGLRSETMRSVALLDEINNPEQIRDNLQQGRVKLVRVNVESLSDAVFEFETEVAKTPKSKPLNTGISYKLTSFDNFQLKATFSLPDEAEDDLKYLFYLYRNILALTEFASDKVVGRTSTNRRVLVSNRAKKNNLLLTLGPVRKALVDFNVYITYRLLLTALFGNRHDVSGGNPLDFHFFEKLSEGYEQAHTSPPTFIVTGKHVYKTAEILRHYLNLDQRKSEWMNLNSFQQNFAGYHSYRELQRLWDKKKEILSNANQQDPDQNVYTVLIEHLKELGIGDRFKIGKLSFYREHTIKL